MGLDDRCWDVGKKGLSAEVANMLCKNHILGLYNILNEHADFSHEELREELERDETTIRYNGYSLAFHMMLPVNIIYEKGMTVTNIDQDEARLRFVRRETRVQILKKYKTFMQSKDEEFALLLPETAPADAKKRVRVINSLIREARDEQNKIRAAYAARLNAEAEYARQAAGLGSGGDGGGGDGGGGLGGGGEGGGDDGSTQSGHSTNEAKRKRKRER